MTTKSVLMRPQGLRPRARAPTPPRSCYATVQAYRYFASKLIISITELRYAALTLTLMNIEKGFH